MKQQIQRICQGLLNRYRVAENALKYLICRAIPCLDRQETWVICERGTDARDNGYAFYRYLVENQPRIRVHYLITLDSADYSKVADHAVAFGSWKNYWVVAKADKIISTHCYTALPVKHEKTWRVMGLAKRFYFLQHGVTKEKMPYMFGDRTGMQLFCCAARPEYAYIKKHYLHPDHVVKCTGFARYDHLLPFHTKRQILVMPTWRRYLKDEDSFLKSDYYAAWSEVLNDERLLDFLVTSGMKLLFYPHYELQPYLKHFRTSSDNVILADFDHYDVQTMLKESMLLITDYSSVLFDFAYMEKPSIYYMFDEARFHRQHYKEGYFSQEQHGFGYVARRHDDVINQLMDIARNDFRMEKDHKSRKQSFFAYHDQRNCERIYQAIMEH